MNKETEMYLVKRVEELSAKYAVAEKINDDLVSQNMELRLKQQTSNLESKKARAFEVLSKFITLVNPVGMETKLVFLDPEIDLNEAMAELFEELLYNK